MAGHPYVTKAYNNKADFPAQGGYAYVPEQHVNWYLVETRTVERVRVPASGYTKFSGAPLKNELLYDSDYENSSPSSYHERENLMANYFNELQIGARPPMKTGNLSSPNKYRPTSPSKYRPKSPNKYESTSPNKYHPTGPNNYYPTSPIKYRPKSPNMYESTSPNKYRPTGPNKYFSTSPIKYRPKSPNRYESTSPNKYRPTSPNKYGSKSPNKYRPTSPNKYLPSSPDKYQPTSPSKYRPTSSPYTYPSKEANMKAQTLPGPKKYQPTNPTKYMPASPTHNYALEEEHMNRPQNISGPNKYRATSPVHSFPIKEVQPIRTQGLSGPNKNLGVGGGRLGDVSSPNYHWQSAGPPTTRHPLTTSTNNIDEALGFLIESYSPRSHLTREGPYDNLSPRAQPNEHNRPYLRSNTIDSHEAVRRYNGAYVP
ncbi:hypothetical protein HanHA300_Chr08g0264611 [Helianthus annuus]|uniref:Uncharacterized protein n=1 Tax=Helianthus annuus TaxID=4232 RepID=A0A251U3F2_HELAN|nr:hypothetical protein HanHA300_Chr08g0264611 [Helianthus annuus]KAJ0545116.1 hypothetical protein HanIR_Chr08g0345941 [Helianthus annuus]KAJ0552131.1 hypothetical protein HanHA89_Chr08g0281441 [Helianthus annuus]KAJ0717836.1 hypothetical protein HanLR1_Chr08g0263581 [Helianthus annuus]